MGFNAAPTWLRLLVKEEGFVGTLPIRSKSHVAAEPTADFCFAETQP
jgi:hypothetical protein